MYEQKGSVNKMCRIRWDIMASPHCGSTPSKGLHDMFIHPSINRTITVREAILNCRVSIFGKDPDSFEFGFNGSASSGKLETQCHQS